MIIAIVFLAILIGACTPSIIWVTFFLKEDLHPAPKRTLIYIFGIGAMMSLVVVVAQFGFQKLINGGAESLIVMLIGLALIEEVFKFFGAYLAVYKSHDIKEPTDAMIFTITAALGFASIENIFALAGAAETFDLQSLYSIGYVIVIRFFGATLLHALASGIVGYYWAKAKFHGPFIPKIITGLVIATAVHVMFNYLVVMYQDKNLLIYPALFLATIMFFVIADFEILKVEKPKGMV